MKTGAKAFIIGSAAYIIPFLFVFHPATLALGTPGETVVAIADGLVAVTALAGCIAGYGISKMSVPERVAAFAVCILVVAPNIVTNITAYALFAALVLIQAVRHFRGGKRSAAQTES